MSKTVSVSVSIGELMDKMTILEIKSVHIPAGAGRENVMRELSILRSAYDSLGLDSSVMDSLWSELRDVNMRLWTIEDEIRGFERRGEFLEDFIELARSVYLTNDIRADIKRRINDSVGSSLREEKYYSDV